MIATVVMLACLAGSPAEPIGKMSHPAIAEASGIVRSRKHPGIFWVHNDSGNPAALFAVKRDGTLVREYAVDVANVDWEDIAVDDQGHLFLGDIGNNGGALPIRAIYRVDEPDPAVPAKGPLAVNLAAYYRFPKAGPFDAESLFVDQGKAIVLSKRLDGREADVFAIPLDPPGPLYRPARAEKVGSLAGFTQPATGADLSEDKGWLAVCSIREVRVYHRGEDGSWLAAGRAECPQGQIEAVCWEGRDLILAGEDRRLWTIGESAWRRETKR